MVSPQIIALLVSILVGVEVLLVFFFLNRVASKSDAEREFEAQLATLNESELEADLDTDTGLKEGSWAAYWHGRFLQTGRKPVKPDQPGQVAILLPLIGFGIGFMVIPGGLSGGLIIAVAGLALLHFGLAFETGRRIKTLEGQLPFLVDSLMSSVNANKTPQIALMDAADEVPSPLGDELRALRTDLELNVALRTALQSFSDRIPSREIKFLVSAIEIAIESGSDLKPQLDVIRSTINSRTRLQQKLASALAEAQPALWVSGIVIPAAVVFSFYSNPTNKDFWLSFNGLIALAVIAFLYLVGLFLTKKIVDGVEKV